MLNKNIFTLNCPLNNFHLAFLVISLNISHVQKSKIYLYYYFLIIYYCYTYYIHIDNY